MSKFSQNWEERRTGMKAVLKPGAPLRQKIELATRRMEAQIQYLNGAIHVLTERDKYLFSKVVDAYSKHEIQRANVYAGELAEMRKMAGFMMNAELALEKVDLRLKTVTQLGNMAAMLAPVGKVIQSIRSGVEGILPNAEQELGGIGMLLDEIMIDAGQTTGIGMNFEGASEDAMKILNEASVVAEQTMKEKFPELPALRAEERAEMVE